MAIVLQKFHSLISGCFSHELADDIDTRFTDFTASLMSLVDYQEAAGVNIFKFLMNQFKSLTPGWKFTISWKLHILCVHVPQFLATRDHGMPGMQSRQGRLPMPT